MWSTLLIRIWILALCLCTALFFLPYIVEPDLTLTLVVSLRSSLPAIARYRRPGDSMPWWKFRCPFSPCSVSPRQGTNWETNVCAGRIVLNIKLSSGTALQQDFVIRNVGWKHLMINILAAVHFAQYFSFAVIMSEINPINQKGITARHFQRDNKRVEADFSISRDYGPSKRHYRVQHVWCLDPENMKDFFERVWDYQAKNMTLRIFCCIDQCSITRILQENDVPLLHRAACKEFVSLV